MVLFNSERNIKMHNTILSYKGDTSMNQKNANQQATSQNTADIKVSNSDWKG